MKIDENGLVHCSEKDIFDNLYQGKLINLSNVLISSVEDLEKFNNSLKKNADNINQLKLYSPLDISKQQFDQNNQTNWFMPAEYKTMDIESYLVHVCPKQNYDRLITELQEYRARNMLDLLRWLKYFVDTCRNNNLVWGVGRGSSVASYTLYLLGVHKIDSVKYKLDIREFFKEGE